MLNDVLASLLKSEFVQSTKKTDLLSNLNFLVTSSAQSRSTFLLLSLSKLNPIKSTLRSSSFTISSSRVIPHTLIFIFS